MVPPSLGQAAPQQMGTPLGLHRAPSAALLLRRSQRVPGVPRRQSAPPHRPGQRPIVRAQHWIERAAEVPSSGEALGVVIVDQSGAAGASASTAQAFAQLYRESAKRVNVEVAHLEAGPGEHGLEQAIRSCLQRGADRVVLVPYSLTKAQRESALPFALADAQRALPSVRCVISEAIGVGDLVVQMIDNRVQAVEPARPVDVSERNWGGAQQAAPAAQQLRGTATAAPTAKPSAGRKALAAEGSSGSAGGLNLEWNKEDFSGERGWAQQAQQAAAQPSVVDYGGERGWGGSGGAQPQRRAAAPTPAPAAKALPAEGGRMTLAFQEEGQESGGSGELLLEAVKKLAAKVERQTSEMATLRQHRELAARVDRQSDDIDTLKAQMAALQSSVQGIERGWGAKQRSSKGAGKNGAERGWAANGTTTTDAGSAGGAWSGDTWGGDGSSAAAAEHGWDAGQDSSSDVIDVDGERSWVAAEGPTAAGEGEEQQQQQPRDLCPEQRNFLERKRSSSPPKPANPPRGRSTSPRRWRW